MKFFTDVPKVLKLKARRFLGLISTFVVVTFEKLVRRSFCPSPLPSLIALRINSTHYVESVRIRSYSAVRIFPDSVLIQRERRNIYPYSVRMRGNMNQNNSGQITPDKIWTLFMQCLIFTHSTSRSYICNFQLQVCFQYA